MRKTVLHIVESLAVGGAEILFVKSLKSITKQYRHVVVYMRPEDSLLSQIETEHIYCLGYKGTLNLMSCAYKLLKILKAENVDLIHSHHYWPTILARLARSSEIPLLFTVHSMLSYDAFKLNRMSFYLEKFTYRKFQHPIFVSKAVMEDYSHYIGIKSRYSVLYNFASEIFYDVKYRKTSFSQTTLKLVAVGNLKTAKNYVYLIEVFKLLKNFDISLVIYGSGPLKKMLLELLDQNDITKISIKGSNYNIHKILHNYDAFILASKYEGLSIALVEAMAIGLPSILSNIKSNIEASGGEAIFFDLASPQDCANKLLELLNQPELLPIMSLRSLERSSAFQKQKYLNELEELYKIYI